MNTQKVAITVPKDLIVIVKGWTNHEYPMICPGINLQVDHVAQYHNHQSSIINRQSQYVPHYPLFSRLTLRFLMYILKIYTIRRDDKMETAKLFQNGSSQAVRLPKAFRIPGNEVKIFKNGNQVILEPIETTWDSLFDSLSEFPEDFMKDGRNQPAMQKRESF